MPALRVLQHRLSSELGSLGAPRLEQCLPSWRHTPLRAYWPTPARRRVPVAEVVSSRRETDGGFQQIVHRLITRHGLDARARICWRPVARAVDELGAARQRDSAYRLPAPPRDMPATPRGRPSPEDMLRDQVGREESGAPQGRSQRRHAIPSQDAAIAFLPSIRRAPSPSSEQPGVRTQRLGTLGTWPTAPRARTGSDGVRGTFCAALFSASRSRSVTTSILEDLPTRRTTLWRLPGPSRCHDVMKTARWRCRARRCAPWRASRRRS